MAATSLTMTIAEAQEKCSSSLIEEAISGWLHRQALLADISSLQISRPPAVLVSELLNWTREGGTQETQGGVSSVDPACFPTSPTARLKTLLEGKISSKFLEASKRTMWK